MRMIKYIIIIILIIFSIENTIMGIEKKITIKQKYFKEIIIPESVIYGFAYFNNYNDLLIMQGRKTRKDFKDLSSYFEIYSYPELKLKYQEDLNIKDNWGVLHPLYTKLIFYNDKLYIEGDAKNEDWFVYYDLKDFSKHKIRKINTDRERLFCKSETGFISYDAYVGIYILDNDFNRIKTITKEEVADKFGVTKYYSMIPLFIDKNFLFICIDNNNVGLINLNNYEIKTILVNSKLRFPNFYRICNNIYMKISDPENRYFPLFRYDFQNNNLIKVDNVYANLFFGKTLDTQYKDLTFFYSSDSEIRGPRSNEMVVVKGEFEKMIKIKVKELKSIGFISNIIEYNDKCLMATGRGIFEFRIEDIYKLLDDYGEKILTKSLELS